MNCGAAHSAGVFARVTLVVSGASSAASARGVRARPAAATAALVRKRRRVCIVSIGLPPAELCGPELRLFLKFPGADPPAAYAAVGARTTPLAAVTPRASAKLLRHQSRASEYGRTDCCLVSGNGYGYCCHP